MTSYRIAFSTALTLAALATIARPAQAQLGKQQGLVEEGAKRIGTLSALGAQTKRQPNQRAERRVYRSQIDAEAREQEQN